MNRKAVSGMKLTLLLIGLSLMMFGIQRVEAGRCAFEWNFDEDWLRQHAYINGDSTRLIVGLHEDEPDWYLGLSNIAIKFEGKVVDSLLIGDKPIAVVELPLRLVYAFATETWDSCMARYIEPDLKLQFDFTPNDELWLYQWAPQKIGANWAWNYTMGSKDVIVAVIDTGVDLNHPDLAVNINLSLSWDYVDNDPYPNDVYPYHGTKVIGVLAAATNNSIGIAGMAQVTVMVEKTGKVEDEAMWLSRNMLAIKNATDKGAKIISMSWGISNDFQALHEAIEYAYNNGVLLVASAGNSASNTPRYPAAYPEVIAVSATYSNDNFASWWDIKPTGEPIGSNFGYWIELSAPGVNITTTAVGNSYVYNRNGTSYSAPYVAGVAALVWSRYLNLTRDELRQHLLYTAKDLGAPGFDIYFGYGRVDARNAVETVPVRHDLFVTLDAPAQLYTGQTAILNATVYNRGLYNETNVELQILINGSIVSSATIASLPCGASYVLSCSWTPTTTGTYNITAYAPPKPNEENTNNNIVTKYIQVASPPTGGEDKALPWFDENSPDEQDQQK